MATEIVKSDMQAVVDAGAATVGIAGRVTDVGGIPLALHANQAGTHVVVLKEALDLADARAAAPRRREGTATHTEVDSFVAHVNRFKDPHTAIFADVHRVTLTAVLDYHAPDAPRWGEHRSLYACPLSRQWRLWMAASSKVLSQDAFGELIDANMEDLASPDRTGPLDADFPAPAAVLEMARNLVVRTSGNFSRTINPTTGESSLVNKVENESTSTRIPRAFLLRLPVFEAGALYRVEARVRFAMADGRPTFSFTLHQPEEIVRDAFAEVRAKVLAGTSVPMFAGSPE